VDRGDCEFRLGVVGSGQTLEKSAQFFVHIPLFFGNCLLVLQTHSHFDKTAQTLMDNFTCLCSFHKRTELFLKYPEFDKRVRLLEKAISR
jgi:DNA polymerase III delta subunit